MIIDNLKIFHKYMMKHKFRCKVASYDTRLKRFKVTFPHYSFGFVSMTADDPHYAEMKNAMDNGSFVMVVPLPSKEGGPYLYAFDSLWRSCEDVVAKTTRTTAESASQAAPASTIEPVPQVDCSFRFSTTDNEYNRALFEALYSSLGDIIDTEEKFALATQLLKANKTLHFHSSLPRELFFKSASRYQNEFWSQELLPYISNDGVKKLWKKADEEEKDAILARLGIENLAASESNHTGCVLSYFSDIANQIIARIRNAQTSILAAVSWFTNFDIFKELKMALGRGVHVEMVINNDLVNNGGYCLNIDELIDAGMVLHLCEYPELINHKFCIFDYDTVLTGSYNWTFVAEEYGRDNVIVTEGMSDVTEAYLQQFRELIQLFPAVYCMPDSVPERPEYDRSSFKQYVSEELVLRAHRRIGNQKELIHSAAKLSPTLPRVAAAMRSYGVAADNNARSTAEMEREAAEEAARRKVAETERLRLEQEKMERQQREQERLVAEARAAKERAEREKAEQMARAADEAQRQRIEQEQREKAERAAAEQHAAEERRRMAAEEAERIRLQREQAAAEQAALSSAVGIETLGGRGKLKINLKWNTTDDVDLHVFDPDGFEIYYSNKAHQCQGYWGRLDVDANASAPYTISPQENIYWDVKAPLGHYSVRIVMFNHRSSQSRVPVVVTVYPEKGEPRTMTATLTFNKEMIDIAQFDYTEEGIRYISTM